MRVVLSTVGRFHMFALARELEARGSLRAIYSGFPWAVLARERVSRDRVRTFPLVRPFLMAAGHLPVRAPSAVTERLHHLSLTTLDAYVSATLPACDVFVGHEGVGLWSGATAKRRNAAYVCDRGCTHIAWKEETLRAEYDRVGVRWPGSASTLARELEEYDRADLVVVPSNFAASSFVASGVDAKKVAVVPYGVSLDVFFPAERMRGPAFEVLFVGGLSVRKGAHDLLTAFEMLDHPDKRLTIAGSVFPDVEAALGDRLNAPNIRRLGLVPHAELRKVMGASDIMVLPSIEEGLALVLAEALASGCPVIATTNTGAEDLFADGVEGFIVPIRSPAEIAEKLTLLAEDRDRQAAFSAAAVSRAQSLGGWRTYGDKMAAVYETLLAGPPAAILGPQ